MITHSKLINRWAKPAIFILALLPFAALLWDGYTDALGAEPIEAISQRSGDWILRFLLLTLTITPLRRISGWNELVRLRRMLGLFAFFYACLHFLNYLVLDQGLDLAFIMEDVIEHKYVLIGFSSFLLLIPLALTSTNAMIRRLGGRRWQKLHRLIYLIAIGGVVHYYWLVKSDIREPLLYAVLLAILLGYRWYHHWSRTMSGAAQNGQINPTLQNIVGANSFAHKGNPVKDN
ncbi:MAG TPA: sulfoxide reductase heme-binding subunit YedZ [Acidiferrobacteraceae bacterium]|nr:sulfoxide reductase heme-binding subunit YedZ [Acidiferrobacteraceae bacterium]